MKKIILIVLVLLSMAFINGCEIEESEIDKSEIKECVCPECNECKFDDTALLNSEIGFWAINEDDDTELFFEYWLFNYGNAESKDIKVRCKLFDENNNVVKSVSSNMGNIASKSAEFNVATTTSTGIKEKSKYWGQCYVESCEDCEILYKNIPELVEIYEID